MRMDPTTDSHACSDLVLMQERELSAHTRPSDSEAREATAKAGTVSVVPADALAPPRSLSVPEGEECVPPAQASHHASRSSYPAAAAAAAAAARAGHGLGA